MNFAPGALCDFSQCGLSAGRRGIGYRRGHMQDPILSVAGLSKTYGTGFKALQNVNLEIRRG
jgi:hypothetical protein